MPLRLLLWLPRTIFAMKRFYAQWPIRKAQVAVLTILESLKPGMASLCWWMITVTTPLKLT
ncbi:Uncharacterised protein [Vibrio cholerae]|nr:Uncharacterised protein [Vibrio cholerae]